MLPNDAVFKMHMFNTLLPHFHIIMQNNQELPYNICDTILKILSIIYNDEHHSDEDKALAYNCMRIFNLQKFNFLYSRYGDDLSVYSKFIRR